MNMSEKQEKMYDVLIEMSSEEVIQLFTDYHGLQLLDDGFYDHMASEGIFEDDYDDEEEIYVDDGDADGELRESNVLNIDFSPSGARYTYSANYEGREVSNQVVGSGESLFEIIGYVAEDLGIGEFDVRSLFDEVYVDGVLVDMYSIEDDEEDFEQLGESKGRNIREWWYMEPIKWYDVIRFYDGEQSIDHFENREEAISFAEETGAIAVVLNSIDKNGTETKVVWWRGHEE
jgi:hypothetical protein